MLRDEEESLLFLIGEEFEMNMEEYAIYTFPVIMDDPIVHDYEHPFCSDCACPCHEVASDEDAGEAYHRVIVGPMQAGLLTAEEANRIFFGEQV